MAHDESAERAEQAARVRYIQRAVDAVDSTADPHAFLTGLTEVAKWLELARDRTAQQLADRGTPAADIGRALGISRQAASKRYPARR